jgi:hypothetical protein
MKLVTFLSQGQERIGAVAADGRILDFHAADPRLAVDMLTLIREQDALMPVARALPGRCWIRAGSPCWRRCPARWPCATATPSASTWPPPAATAGWR